jgi:hypothetical protein
MKTCDVTRALRISTGLGMIFDTHPTPKLVGQSGFLLRQPLKRACPQQTLRRDVAVFHVGKELRFHPCGLRLADGLGKFGFGAGHGIKLLVDLAGDGARPTRTLKGYLSVSGGMSGFDCVNEEMQNPGNLGKARPP